MFLLKVLLIGSFLLLMPCLELLLGFTCLPPAFSPQGNRDESPYADQGLAKEDAQVSTPFAGMSRQFAALFPNCFSFKLGIT